MGTITHLNIASAWKIFEPLIPDPKVRTMLEGLGAARLTAVSSVSGLDGQGIVRRDFVDVTGLPAGLGDKPLTAADLTPIPDNASFAAAARFDLVWLYRQVLDFIAKTEPDADAKAQIAQAEKTLGFEIEGDLLASFGDVWTVHATPEGILPLGGLVITATVRDREKFQKVHDTLLGMAAALLKAAPDAPATLETKTHRGIEMHHVQVNGPVAWDPAWAVVDGRLVVAATLQALKSHINRGGKRSLAAVPAVVERLKEGPITLTYQDTRAALEQAFGWIKTVGPMVIGQLATSGIKIELPTLPDLEAIGPLILPQIDTTRRTADGLESVSTCTVPIGSLGAGSPATIGVAVALLLPAVNGARAAARQNQEMNQLKQIGIALQNAHDVKKRFPAAAIRDKEGKPLLSWRVAILPDLDEVALYNEFHLDEPWDSEHNKPLLEKMPEVYKNARVGDLGNKTVYLVPVGKETVFSDIDGANMRTITDGASRTILVVEVEPDKAVLWTKPDDLEIDPKHPEAGLGKDQNGMFTVLAVDCSVHLLPAGIDPKDLWALFTRAGREEVTFPDLEAAGQFEIQVEAAPAR